jgi:hypothetical protein
MKANPHYIHVFSFSYEQLSRIVCETIYIQSLKTSNKIKERENGNSKCCKMRENKDEIFPFNQ